MLINSIEVDAQDNPLYRCEVCGIKNAGLSLDNDIRSGIVQRTTKKYIIKAFICERHLDFRTEPITFAKEAKIIIKTIEKISEQLKDMETQLSSSPWTYHSSNEKANK